ncbi:Protein of unknown function (DUF3189) [Halobacteroides halobius DSM 5150]|uniref:DUF3189 domain-containing protein n=1 Tax=Halobacteroides halobius (strain ATCC 35273 / DSM 5150 / MD-1) TaxID=748449 RepID=L0K8C0_HALHC|nr:DUF3189 family protein [Halobacteroides halobius]AGB41532.1 Protein of unknown function (DUF3189) [Halobacteroides halobius DSM 5150]
MKIIYYCYGSAHSSVLAAAIHVGKLPNNRIANKKEITQLPYYDKTKSYQIGTPFYYGQDEFNNEVYIIGMGSKRDLTKEILLNFLKMHGIDSNKLILVSALPYVNLLTKIGGNLSRRFGLVKVGRPLTIYSLQKVYFKFVDLVAEVKMKIRQFKANNSNKGNKIHLD